MDYMVTLYSYGPTHIAKQKQDDQLELTYSSYVRTQDVTLKTCQMRWIIGRSGERGSGISVLAARHDDDDDDMVTSTRSNLEHFSIPDYFLITRESGSWLSQEHYYKIILGYLNQNFNPFSYFHAFND